MTIAVMDRAWILVLDAILFIRIILATLVDGHKVTMK